MPAARCRWRGRTTCSCDAAGSCRSSIATLRRYPDLGLLSLSRGLNCLPVRRSHRHAGTTSSTGAGCRARSARARSTGSGCRRSMPSSGRGSSGAPVSIGGTARRALRADRVGRGRPRVPHSRGRVAQSRPTATSGLARTRHLGSTTIGVLSDDYKQRVLEERPPVSRSWDEVIRERSGRPRRVWWRRMSTGAWRQTAASAARSMLAGGLKST